MSEALLDELAGVDAKTDAAPEAKADDAPKVETISAEELSTAKQAQAAAEAKLVELQTGLAEQIKQLRAERQAEKPADAPKAPEFLTDPEGNLKFVLAQKEAEFTKALDEMRSKSEEERNMMAQRIFQNSIAQAELQFSGQHADYYDALNHVRSIRAKELALVGFDTAKIPTMLAQEEMGLGVQAINQGKHPAQVAYERAKLLGYSEKSDPQKAAEQLAPDPEAERRVRAEKAQSMGGGGSPDLDQLLNADEDVFAAAFQDLLGAKLR